MGKQKLLSISNIVHGEEKRNDGERLTVTATVHVQGEKNHLTECLKSLLNQTVQPDEVLILARGSVDKAKDIAISYNCRVIETPDNEVGARHKGFEEALGDVVISCDPDTHYPPTYVEKLVEPLDKGEAVATMGYVKGHGAEGTLRDMYNSLMDIGAKGLHMPREANAVLRKAYFESGGLNVGAGEDGLANSFGVGTVLEEEVDFPERLAELGKIERVNVETEKEEETLVEEHQLVENVASDVPKTVLLSLGASALGLAATHNKNAGKLLTGIGLGFAGGELGAKLKGNDSVLETYEKGEERDPFQDLDFKTDAHIHHDLVGLAMVGLGSIVKNPETIGTGLGLISHHIATEGASFIGAIRRKEDEGKEVKVPVDEKAGVYEVVEL